MRKKGENEILRWSSLVLTVLLSLTMGNDTSVVEETTPDQSNTTGDEEVTEEAIAAYFNTNFKISLSPEVFRIRCVPEYLF